MFEFNKKIALTLFIICIVLITISIYTSISNYKSTQVIALNYITLPISLFISAYIFGYCAFHKSNNNTESNKTKE